MSKHEEIKQRTLKAAHFIVKNNTTIRKTAQKLGYSKTTIHMDLTERLPEYNTDLARQVRLVIEANKQERALRGGMALKNKYLMQKQK